MLTHLHAYDLSSLFACDRCGAGILNFIIFGQNILWTEHSYLAAAIKMDLVRPFLVENIFCGGWNRTELSFAICSEVSEIWKGRSEFETLCRKNWGQKRAYFRVVYNKIVTSLWVSSERNALDYWKNTFKLLGSLYYPKIWWTYCPQMAETTLHFLTQPLQFTHGAQGGHQIHNCLALLYVWFVFDMLSIKWPLMMQLWFWQHLLWHLWNKLLQAVSLCLVFDE